VLITDRQGKHSAYNPSVMKHHFSFILVALLLLSLTGCGIIGGAGQDISSVGHVVTKSANAVKSTL